MTGGPQLFNFVSPEDGVDGRLGVRVVGTEVEIVGEALDGGICPHAVMTPDEARRFAEEMLSVAETASNDALCTANMDHALASARSAVRAARRCLLVAAGAEAITQSDLDLLNPFTAMLTEIHDEIERARKEIMAPSIRK